ncbi:hypothetical protein J1614_010413 [Plenodomus biglobosus]|nr:hypothetical protein J1614_010413 [Plenodomus biglobosus]
MMNSSNAKLGRNWDINTPAFKVRFDLVVVNAQVPKCPGDVGGGHMIFPWLHVLKLTSARMVSQSDVGFNPLITTSCVPRGWNMAIGLLLLLLQ